MGLPHRPLERQPRLEAACSLTTRAVQDARKVTLAPAGVYCYHRIWGFESGSHRSRSLLSIPFRGSQADWIPTGVTESEERRGRRDASTVLFRKERVSSVRQVKEAVLLLSSAGAIKLLSSQSQPAQTRERKKSRTIKD